MARIVAVGEPANETERLVIRHLERHAPDSWTVLHNVELPSGNRRFEIDLVVVAPHAVHVVDVKGTRGTITVSGAMWHPHGRAPFRSPVPKLRQHARVLKSLLEKADPRLSRLYVGQLVVLPDEGAELRDPDHRDEGDVCHLTELIDLLGDHGRVPGSFDARAGLGRDAALLRVLVGQARPPSGPRVFGSWEVVERLAEAEDGVEEFRARNRSLPGGPPQVLLRLYPLDPYLPAPDRERQRRELGNAYTTLGRLPGHPHVVGHRDYLVTDDETAGVLVLDDTPGMSLRLRMSRSESLSRDEALRILRGVASGLTHAHRHRVVHRALGPDTVLLATDGRALLIGFDHARGTGPRATVVNRLPDAVDPDYVAPEGQVDVGALDAASDVYALGVLGYRLLSGELPFTDAADQKHRRSVPPAEPLAAAGVPDDLATWCTALCALDPADRPTAAQALLDLDRATRRPPPPPVPPAGGGGGGGNGGGDWRDRLRDLPEGHELTPALAVRRRLGSGSFGVVYLVHNTLARTDQVLKLILTDPEDLVDRLAREYRPLLELPPHRHVVQVRHGDLLTFPDAPPVPYLLFDHVPGRDVHALAGEGLLGPAEVRRLGVEAAAGCSHIHGHGVFHCDIKPGNLLWTDDGARLIDFNVAVSDTHVLADAGSRRYLPPDYRPHDPDLVDRDVYALGLTLYEALTRRNWPWDDHRGATGEPPRDPRVLTELAGLSAEFVDVLLRAIAPTRAERYADASAFRAALEAVRHVRTPPVLDHSQPTAGAGAVDNPFVAHLQTLYSQSSTSNSGTRGLDPHQYSVYVPTLLDDRLIPDVLAGRHRIVIITGNAGDGKTALLERLVARAQDEWAELGPARSNGADFSLAGHRFHTNLDGSQDEGDRANDDVLSAFFTPFAGIDPTTWPSRETRLIAINEGRLVDFLRAHTRFGALRSAVEAASGGAGGSANGVTVVNLNARSVVAGEPGESIFDALVREMTHERFWSGCAGCALADRCYALHNARTLAHPDAGSRIVERLRTLYTVTHLRGRLHITVRDLRSALAYLLTSGRSCVEIRDLYANGDSETILSGFYFQSWSGPAGTQDRLLALLRESDLDDRADPALSRQLDFVGPTTGALLELDGRGKHDQDLLTHLFDRLPRAGDGRADRPAAHRVYVEAGRRRFYFESADGERWRRLLSHRSAAAFLDALKGADGDTDEAVLARDVVHAINRSEGLAEPAKLGSAMALAVRQVRGGAIRSYRLFPLDRFAVTPERPRWSDYVEAAPEFLRLTYTDPAPGAEPVTIGIRLDLHELLWRLRRGGRPAAADLQGQHLSLAVFKNMLTSAPYQAVVLTVTGHDLHTVERTDDGTLTLSRVTGPVAPDQPGDTR